MLTKKKTEYIIDEMENFQMLKKLFLREQNSIMKKAIIAGGVFKNVFNHEEIKDVDVFFRTYSDYYECREQLKLNREEYELVYTSENVHAFKNKATGIVFELIETIFGEPKTILDEFDFTVTKFALYSEVDKGEAYKVMFHPEFFTHLHLKRLVIDNKINFPLSTFERSFKYKSYGYGLCRESKTKLIKAIRDIPEAEIDYEHMLPGRYLGID